MKFYNSFFSPQLVVVIDKLQHPVLFCLLLLYARLNYELRITNYELRITNYELRITNYELRITNYEVKNNNLKKKYL